MATERTRFFVDGVRTAITADVTRRRPHGLVVTQALPFLRLDTKVVGDDGRPARISRVAISMDGDVPRLMLELATDDIGLEAPVTEKKRKKKAPHAVLARVKSAKSAKKREDDTLVTFTPGVSQKPERADSTEPYEFERRQSRTVVVSERPPYEPFWQRFFRKVTIFLAALTRPTPALPRG